MAVVRGRRSALRGGVAVTPNAWCRHCPVPAWVGAQKRMLRQRPRADKTPRRARRVAGVVGCGFAEVSCGGLR